MVGAGMMAEVDQDALVRMMVGRPVDRRFPPRAPSVGAEVLRVEGYRHPTAFEDVSFALHAGEILGFHGLVGAGRSEVMQALFGATRPSRGTLRWTGRRGACARQPAPSPPGSSPCPGTGAGGAR